MSAGQTGSMDRPRPPGGRVARLEALRALLFDLDGTLIAVDREAARRHALRLPGMEALGASERFGRWAHRAIMLTETPSNYLLAFAEKLGIDTDTLLNADRLRRFRGLGTSSASSLVPGAFELLHALAGRFLLGVVTSRSRASAARLLNHNGIEGLFKVVTTRHDTWLLKPAAAPIKRTAQLLGVDPRECLMVGDTTMDMRSAKSAGALAVGVLTGLGDGDEIIRAGADLVLESVADLHKLLLPASA